MTAEARSPTGPLADAVRTVAGVVDEHGMAWDALDAATADGDFGSTMRRGFGSVVGNWDTLDGATGRSLLADVGRILAREMGGTSGPLWSVGFLRAAAVIDEHDELDVPVVAAMLRAAVEGVRSYGGADVGDKTMLDALVPVAESLESSGTLTAAGAATAAARAAVDGAQGTRELRARRGRGAYAGHRTIGEPDPGAVAVAAITVFLAQRLGADIDDQLARLQELHGTQDVRRRQDSEVAQRVGTQVKQFLNQPQDAPLEALSGLATAHPELVVWDADQGIVHRPLLERDGRVGLVSGGGSGHEPLHVGFVGAGMLAAAAPGGVFASPSLDQVLAATLAADRGGGVVQIVKNYTGDVMNFRLAAELAREDGLDVRSVLVADDVASGDAEHGVGRRGTAAALLVEKIAGACADAGGTLEEVVAVAERTARRSASIGVALSACTIPGSGPAFELSSEEIELGVGIHGELGFERAPMAPADRIATGLTDRLLDALRPSREGRLLAFVNGFGGTSVLELYLVFRALSARLDGLGFEIARSLVGSYVTSLDMAGLSITLLELDDELEAMWDAPVCTPGLRWGC